MLTFQKNIQKEIGACTSTETKMAQYTVLKLLLPSKILKILNL